MKKIHFFAIASTFSSSPKNWRGIIYVFPIMKMEFFF